MDFALPTIDDVRAASVKLAGRVVRTPLIEARAATKLLGRRVLAKAEVLQTTGSFKFRGALGFLDRLDPETRQRGIVAFSSGNHAQGAAAAAAVYGIPATVVMPADAPAIKIERTLGWGARVVHYDRATEDREAIAVQIATDEGLTVVPPYNHPWTIAGQGSIGLEIAEQCESEGVDAPVVLAPAGGGGLCAGLALALEGALPSADLFAVEPAGWDDHRLSLAAGQRVPVGEQIDSICDALQTSIPGEVPFAINKRLLSGALAVTDDEVRHAMRHAFEDLKLVVEPGGAVGLAALLAGQVAGTGPVVVVLSGGNVDALLFADALRS